MIVRLARGPVCEAIHSETAHVHVSTFHLVVTKSNPVFPENIRMLLKYSQT